MYLGRGVRTVQRWEEELQLPVHRIGTGRRSPVFAFEHELRFWLQATNVAIKWRRPTTAGGPGLHATVIQKSVELANQLLAATQENRRLMNSLVHGLEKMRQYRRDVRAGREIQARVRAAAHAWLTATALENKTAEVRRKGATPVIAIPAARHRYASVAS